MTHFNDHNTSRVTPRLTAEDDDLDHFLNTHLASDGPPDADERCDVRELDSLGASASNFHRRMEAAQNQNPQASRPEPNLWERILDQREVEEQESDMSSTPLALDNHPIRTFPVSASLPRLNRKGMDISRWTNAIAAAVLIIAIGAGYWFSGYGPGGGQGGGAPQYAALGLTPGASPDAGTTGCTVEPLTTDQVIAYVENPYSFMPGDAFGTPAPGEERNSIAEGLEEVGPMSGLVDSRATGIVPTEGDFQDAYEIADQYFACLAEGTNAQVWALTDPGVIQQMVLNQLPVYRNQDDVRELVTSIRDEPASNAEWSLVIDGSTDGRAVYANSNVQDARVFDQVNSWMYNDADMVMYIGEEFRDEDESVVALTDWNATALVGGEEQSNGTSLILVHSNSTDRWFVVMSNAPRG